MRKALIIQGGWDGHEPVQVSEVFARVLREEGFSVQISDTLDTLLDKELMQSLHLLVPAWTMGEITAEQSEAASLAVASGVGLAGCHGGMCDSFRQDVNWQFMTGIGYRHDRFTVSLRHLSNANTGGRNRGGKLLLFQYGF